MISMKRRKTPATNPQDPARAPVELASRLIYSLFKAAVRLAARFSFSKTRLVDLLELAYFAELRQHAPRDLQAIAKQLDLSLRSVAALSKKLKSDFFKPESEIAPLRAITAALTNKEMSFLELQKLLAAQIDQATIERGLTFLQQCDWVREKNGVYSLTTTLRSFVSDDWLKRIDGLNHQMTIIAESVRERFIAGNDTTAVARNWVFTADQEAIKQFIAETVTNIRHKAVDLEELALAKNLHDRFAISIAITPYKETPDE